MSYTRTNTLHLILSSVFIAFNVTAESVLRNIAIIITVQKSHMYLKRSTNSRMNISKPSSRN